MMSPRPMTEDRGSSPNFRHTPLQIIHMVGNFFRIWSIYSMYRYFSQTGASVVLFLFCCLAPAAIIFLTLQKPWKGKPLSNTQVVPSVINGAITALYFILWGKGLKACGPLRAVLAEYSGAVLGVLSAVLHGRRGFVWKKVVGGNWMYVLGHQFYLRIIGRIRKNMKPMRGRQVAKKIITMKPIPSRHVLKGKKARRMGTREGTHSPLVVGIKRGTGGTEKGTNVLKQKAGQPPPERGECSTGYRLFILCFFCVLSSWLVARKEGRNSLLLCFVFSFSLCVLFASLSVPTSSVRLYY
ncbi:uncharacterized protein LOC103500159 isoform X4 [Cucumis melo]|uniref:Uncharacterized protein LOC103500159 isoform X4 n=1 Tax=Cucumis melo TaxID=3656 RepID=A0ABM3KWM5_CUCME|nr:uncharacterized protein LOC103500159 isoform X4 [Cucumis melo]